MRLSFPSLLPPRLSSFEDDRAVSMRPWLQTMVSSDEEDVTRLPSARMERNFAPPFALAFSYCTLSPPISPWSTPC